MTSSLLRDRVWALCDELEALDPDGHDGPTCAALAKLRGRIGHTLAVRADSHALDETSLPSGESKTGAQKLVRRLLAGRPWRTKVVSSTEGRWTLALKTYTDIGTVVAYAGTPEKAVALTEALDRGLDGLRTKTPWEGAREEVTS